MRSYLVLLALVFALVGAAFCVEKGTAELKDNEAKGNEVKGNEVKGNEMNGNYVPPYALTPENSPTAWDTASASGPIVKRHLQLSPYDTTCYTMRSMLVAKEPGSDVTEIVGQRTCTPSSRFQMKHSVLHREISEP
jgi:hypothetical protein